MSLDLWNSSFQPLSISYSVQVDSASLETVLTDDIGEPVNATLTFNAARPIEYRLRKYRIPPGAQLASEWQIAFDGPWQNSGDFTLGMDSGEDYVVYFIYFRYEYHSRIVWADQTVWEDRDELRTSTSFVIYMNAR